MKYPRVSHPLFRLAMALAATLFLVPAALGAQQGQVVGTVIDTFGDPISGATVTVEGTRRGTISRPDGSFSITDIPIGTHVVRAQRLGYRQATVGDVRVEADRPTEVALTMESRALEMEGVVVSAARREQRLTEAPVTITRIDPNTFGESVGAGFAPALKQAIGLDFIQVGATTAAINARGFNSSFNNRMLMMEDGRIAVLPENGLPVGQFTASPRIDLAGIEVLVGPGAALYGADASNGVVTLQTKDPRDYPGTSAEITGGTRSFGNVQARHAGLFGNFGYKVTGEWLGVDEFQNQLFYTAAELPEIGVGGEVNWRHQTTRGQGALVHYGDAHRFELSAGASSTDAVGQTNVGRNQLDDWTYNFLQAQLNLGPWYFNAYRTQSQAGNSYALNRFTEFAAATDLGDAEIRDMAAWPSDGRLYAAEVQHSLQIAPLLGTTVTWGGQFRHDRVSSDRRWLTDRLLEEDLTINQVGAYAQTETPLTDALQLVLAARVDEHDNYDLQFSPKAALVFAPAADQAIRLTYNRAFKAPTTLQTSFWIPDFTPAVGVFGNTRGFIIRHAETDAEITRYDPLRPEENQTWELGYRGALGDRLFLDVAAYRAQYQDFLSPLIFIGDQLGLVSPEPIRAYFMDDGAEVGPATILELTYINLGEATIHGTDAGATFALTPRVSLRGTLSWLDLQSREPGDLPAGQEATALNAPDFTWTLGARAVDLGPLNASTTFRSVKGYDFHSGINRGRIPSHATLDAAVGYRIPQINSEITLSAQNLFACGAEESAPFGESGETSCGFGQRHVQMVNMPAIGTMVYLGLRYNL